MFLLNRARVSCLLAALTCGLAPAGIAAASSGASTERAAATGTTERVSVDSDEAQLTSASRVPYVRPTTSGHGRYVTFQTYEPVTGSDNNNREDVVVRDRVLGTTEPVSVAGGRTRSGGGATISTDGRYVAFLSDSSALVPDDDNGAYFDVFVRDRRTGELTLVSTATDGTQRRVDSNEAVISGDGSRVAFTTAARLSPADDDTAPVDQPFNRLDVYVHNLANGHTRLASVNARGANFTGPVGMGGMSYNGRLVGFSWGNSGRDRPDVPAGYYVRDMAKPGAKLIWREDLNIIGNQASGAPALSGNGRFAAFASESQRLDAESDFARDDVARYDRRSGQLSLVSVGAGSANADGDSWGATLSHRGDRLSFASDATNLVAGDDNDATDAFLLDLSADQMTLVSAAPDGSPGRGTSAFGGGVAISADGLHVAFTSFAPDLVPGDTNGKHDVFLWTAFD